jgi:hypothetical protein
VVATIEATEAKSTKTAAITAEAIGISARKVELASAVLSDLEEAATEGLRIIVLLHKLV